MKKINTNLLTGPVFSTTTKKISFFLFLLFFGFQSIAQIIEKDNQLLFRNVPLENALKKIARDKNLKLVYDARLLNNIMIDSLSLPKNANSILDSILSGTLLDYKISNNLLIIHQKNGAKRTITGRITDADSGNPMEGVSIFVKNSNVGTVSDANGAYHIDITDDNSILQFSNLGHKTQEIPAGGKSYIDISLAIASTQMSDVVVTSLGIKKENRQLGYAFQTVNGSALTEARESNLLNTLSGKVAGAQITNGPSSIGGSATMVIRGDKSLSGNSQPLFVIDGIPIDNSINGTHGETVDFGNGISEVNPDNIETINILKGANAAALYGSRAANGVVVITTKTGSKNQKIGITLNSNYSIEDVLKMWKFQNKYGEGENGQFAYVDGKGGGTEDGTAYNWGPAMDGHLTTQFNSPLDPVTGKRTPTPFISYGNNLKNDFLQTGTAANNAISFSGGDDKGKFRFSYSNLSQTGIIPNTDLKRNTLAFTSSYSLTKQLSVEVNANLIKSGSDNLPLISYSSGSIMYAFLWYPRSTNIRDLHNYWMPGLKGISQFNYDNNWTNNLWFIVNENTNSFNRNREFGNVKANYDFNRHWNLLLRAGIDTYNEMREQKRAMSDRAFPQGEYVLQQLQFQELNTDFLLSYHTSFNDRFNLSVSGGGNKMAQSYMDNNNTAAALSIPDIYNLGNSSVPITTLQNSYKKEINSLYYNVDLSYQKSLFLNITGRNDWSSTLPPGNNSYFYPSISVSGILSEWLDLQRSPVSFWKVRAGWAQVGSDATPYSTSNYYNYAQPWGTKQTLTESSSIANANLKPEISGSLEFGTNIKFFKDRLGIDATYYHVISKNQIIAIPLSSTTTYAQRFINAGEISNNGVELMLTGTPLKTKNFNWEININWSANRNKVIALTNGINTYVQSSSYLGQASLEARVGGRMGDIYGKVFQRDPNGNIIYSGGLPLITSNESKIGNSSPDWISGIGNSLRYKSIGFSFLFDIHYGGSIYNLSYARAMGAGTLLESAAGNYRETGIVGKGVIDNGNGTYRQNDVKVAYFPYLRSYYSYTNAESNTFSATYVKLREVKLTYFFPKNLIRKIASSDVSVSLVGRNLLLWDKVPDIDPEDYQLNGSTISQGLDGIRLPSTRSYGLNLNIKF